MKIEQKFDQVKEDYKLFGRCIEDPYLSSFLPAAICQQAEKHMALVDVVVAELLVVLTEGCVGDLPTGDSNNS